MSFAAEQGRRRAFNKLALAFLLAVLGTVVAVLEGGGSDAREADAGAEVNAVLLDALPVEAQHTHRRILSGGPFPFAKDGSVFFNRERRLPMRPRGNYREYTVKTPGARDRGARRIVCGGTTPTAPDACFYTGDHYTSFMRFVWRAPGPSSAVD